MVPNYSAALAVGAALLLPAPAQAVQQAPLNTLRDITTALNACYISPPRDQVFEGMQVTVRFSLTREGTLLGEPRFAFFTREAVPVIRIAYRKAVLEAFQRCMPLPLTPSLAAAIAGRPFAWRLQDNRKQRKA